MPERWRQSFASTEAAHERMSRQRRRDTSPELELRRAVHGLGLRYFVHRRPLPAVRREADFLFPRAKVAVFVDGCFWHACPEHGTSPRVNNDYWGPKLARNVERDRSTDEQLIAAGWEVVRVWEHEAADVGASRVERAVRSR